MLDNLDNVVQEGIVATPTAPEQVATNYRKTALQALNTHKAVRAPIPLSIIKSGLMISDLFVLWLCLNATYWLRFDSFASDYLLNFNFLWVGLVATTIAYIFDAFDPSSQISGLRAPGRFLLTALVSAAVITFILYMTGSKAADQFGRGVMVGAFSVFSAWGAMTRLYTSTWLKSRGVNLRWLVIGDKDYMCQLSNDFEQTSMDGQMVYLTRGEREQCTNELPVVGTWEEIDDWMSLGWSGIIICTEEHLPEDILERLLHERMKGTRVYNLTDYYEDVWFKVPVYYLDRTWLALTQGFGLLHNPIGLRIKRIFDVLGAVFLLPLAIPMILLGAVLVFVENGWPVIYRQKRTGINGKTFTLYKLRTMRHDAESEGAKWADKNDRRVTFFGRILRKTRVDELPQIWNVLKGDMSFIGPRPERPEFVAHLEQRIPHYNLRQVVRPGITGWAQVLFRYGSSINDSREKLQYDLYYIKNYSVILDIAIILKTFRVMMFGAGR